VTHNRSPEITKCEAPFGKARGHRRWLREGILRLVLVCIGRVRKRTYGF
jgi:hypothetical protein